MKPMRTVTARAQSLYRASKRALHARVDRLMLIMLLVQWIFAIVFAVTVTPYTWFGATRAWHVHLQTAIALGLAINTLPLLMCALRPGWWLTRHVIAAAQLLWSGVLIHLTGGRIETHFHIFGSLAFLAFYRDWRVLVTATLVMTADHILREIWLPQSIYGVTDPEWWRFIEHAAWVVFENLVLALGCVRSDREMQVVAEREARLADLAMTLETRVEERTGELERKNGELQESIERARTMQRELIDASRRAGMADAATAVLHNVGNILNSVNVSVTLVGEAVTRSKAAGLVRLAQLIDGERAQLARFLTEDERGRKLPDYLSALGRAVDGERESLLRELALLDKHLGHVKSIVSMQQSYAKAGGLRETLSLNELVEDALALHVVAHERGAIVVTRELGQLPLLSLDRHKIFQVLTNLVTNAEEALRDRPHDDAGAREIVVRSRQDDDGMVRVDISDSGVGIAAQHLDRIFALGFTTKKDGHGFGLHASACAAQELGGSLTVRSDGLGRGATFTLALPWRDAGEGARTTGRALRRVG